MGRIPEDGCGEGDKSPPAERQRQEAEMTPLRQIGRGAREEDGKGSGSLIKAPQDLILRREGFRKMLAKVRHQGIHGETVWIGVGLWPGPGWRQ